MDVLLIILVLYLGACVVFAQASEDLFEILGQVIAFAVMMVVSAVFYAAVMGWRGLLAAGLFIGIMIDELLKDFGLKRRRGEYSEEDNGDDQVPEASDLCEGARRVLGLPEEFSKGELKAAFHEAMKRAHPDAGGTVESAQKINEAREIIELEKGWA